jgi:hypothetical protein
MIQAYLCRSLEYSYIPADATPSSSSSSPSMTMMTCPCILSEATLHSLQARGDAFLASQLLFRETSGSKSINARACYPHAHLSSHVICTILLACQKWKEAWVYALSDDSALQVYDIHNRIYDRIHVSSRSFLSILNVVLEKLCGLTLDRRLYIYIEINM